MTTSPLADLLSATDLDVMRMIAAGWTQQQITRRSGLGRSAVAMRTSRIRQRIGATTTAHAVALLARDGLIDLSQIAGSEES